MLKGNRQSCDMCKILFRSQSIGQIRSLISEVCWVAGPHPDQAYHSHKSSLKSDFQSLYSPNHTMSPPRSLHSQTHAANTKLRTCVDGLPAPESGRLNFMGKVPFAINTMPLSAARPPTSTTPMDAGVFPWPAGWWLAQALMS